MTSELTITHMSAGVGPTDQLTETVLMAAAWVINVAVAEFVILRRARTAGVSRRPVAA